MFVKIVWTFHILLHHAEQKSLENQPRYGNLDIT